MTAVYHITVDAASDQDAIDIAERRAREDGWKPLTCEYVRPVGVHREGQLNRWAVKLSVKKEGTPR